MSESVHTDSYNQKITHSIKFIIEKNIQYEEIKKHLICINSIFTEISSIRGENSDEAKKNCIILPTGMAISPQFAAMNLRDVIRTSKYLCAVKEAIDISIKREKGKKIHILYPGCGPYGSLVLPILALYSPDQIKVTLIDVQQDSLNSVKKICEKTGLIDFIADIINTDAADYKHPQNDPIHIIVMECMLHALAREPQVSITKNLSSQLVKNGLIIPEKVIVSIYAVDPEKEFGSGYNDVKNKKSRQYINDVFVLDKNAHKLKVLKDANSDFHHIKAAEITLPENLNPSDPIMFFTKLKLFKNIFLNFYESGITHPLIIPGNDNLKNGDKLFFKYRINSYPEFYYEKKRLDPWG